MGRNHYTYEKRQRELAKKKKKEEKRLRKLARKTSKDGEPEETGTEIENQEPGTEDKVSPDAGPPE